MENHDLQQFSDWYRCGLPAFRQPPARWSHRSFFRQANRRQKAGSPHSSILPADLRAAVGSTKLITLFREANAKKVPAQPRQPKAVLLEALVAIGAS